MGLLVEHVLEGRGAALEARAAWGAALAAGRNVEGFSKITREERGIGRPSRSRRMDTRTCGVCEESQQRQTLTDCDGSSKRKKERTNRGRASHLRRTHHAALHGRRASPGGRTKFVAPNKENQGHDVPRARRMRGEHGKQNQAERRT